MKKLAMIVTALIVGVMPVSAQSLDDMMKPDTQKQAVTLKVACGRTDKENCNVVVVPKVNHKLVGANSNVSLEPLASQGSVQTMQALCKGVIDAGVVQADVFAAMMQTVECDGKVTPVGAPLYPYYINAIVRASQSEGSISDMVNDASGKQIKTSAGGPGSGGELSLRQMIAVNPNWGRVISIEPDKADAAVGKLQDGTLDMVIVADGPKSPLLEKIKSAVDKDNNPIFKIIETSADPLMSLQYNGKSQLYAQARFHRGFMGFGSKYTLVVPAVFVVRNSFYSNQTDTVIQLRKAIQDALPDIAAEVGAPSNWSDWFNR